MLCLPWGQHWVGSTCTNARPLHFALPCYIIDFDTGSVGKRLQQGCRKDFTFRVSEFIYYPPKWRQPSYLNTGQPSQHHKLTRAFLRDPLFPFRSLLGSLKRRLLSTWTVLMPHLLCINAACDPWNNPLQPIDVHSRGGLHTREATFWHIGKCFRSGHTFDTLTCREMTLYRNLEEREVCTPNGWLTSMIVWSVGTELTIVGPSTLSFTYPFTVSPCWLDYVCAADDWACNAWQTRGFGGHMLPAESSNRISLRTSRWDRKSPDHLIKKFRDRSEPFLARTHAKSSHTHQESSRSNQTTRRGGTRDTSLREIFISLQDVISSHVAEVILRSHRYKGNKKKISDSGNCRYSFQQTNYEHHYNKGKT